MKKRLLVISPRFPDLTSKRDRRLNYILESLVREYEIDLVYIQSLFIDDAQIKRIEEKGIRVWSLKELRQKKKGDFGSPLEEMMLSFAYEAIIFSTHFTAKYYLPYLRQSGSRVIIDAGRSQYISELRFAEKTKIHSVRAVMIENAEAGKLKEIAIYNNADAVIVDNEENRATLQKDIPRVEVIAIPAPAEGQEDRAKENAERVISAIAATAKRRENAVPPVDIIVVETARRGGDAGAAAGASLSVHNVVEGGGTNRIPWENSLSLGDRFNRGLETGTSPFVLITTDELILPRQSLERLLFCLQSHPSYAIAIPSSNLVIGHSFTPKDLGAFLPRHFAVNFGYWHETKQIEGRCLLIRRELIGRVGLLDIRFNTLRYALVDMSFKAFQAGYKTLVNNEAFVYYHAGITENETQGEKDKKLLYEKWCNAGTEFLESLH